MSRIKVAFNNPLNDGDTEYQTYGCRQNNPEICSSNSMDGICAFIREDNICKKPSRSWKKKYNELKEAEKNE